jgi:hypothetical protein
MSANHFIPAGRTSTVKKGEIIFQIQTEYAYRPMPRITTTVSNQGRVVHKIERALDRPVESLEEQNKTEVVIKRQHAEVISILETQDQNAPMASSAPATPQLVTNTAVMAPVVVAFTAEDTLKKIPGVTHVYTLDNEGNFHTDHSSEQFQKTFSPVFRSIRDLIQMFGKEPGVGFMREQGVVEIERDRLYFASSGTECYFVVVRRVNVTIDYEREIKSAIQPPQ